MDDGTPQQKPRVRPPPRIPAAGKPDPDAGAGGSNRPFKTGRQIAMFAAMALGLLAVFVLLPRWQERRQTVFVAGTQAVETAPTVEIPSPGTPERSPTAEMPVSQPNPVPTPTLIPTPVAPPPRNTPRPQPSAAERQYVDAMSEGLTALDNRRWQVALDAFSLASRLRPDAPEVADGLSRARAGQRLETIVDGIQAARASEQSEDWRKAERAYSAVLALDPESAAALDGQKRTDVRATLDETIEYHLSNPGRLSAPKVFSDATAALEDAMETVPSGPRLEGQISRLEILLKHVSTPVAVVLESDDLTEVLVYRVGRLGTFSRRELNLKPGAYTVVGSRHGYRDIRLQLVITPGSPPKPLVVRCTESL